MAAQRYLLIDTDGVARNVILLDPEAEPEWTPPEGFTLQPDDGRPIVVDAVEASTSQPEPMQLMEQQVADLQAQLDAVLAKLEELT